MDGFSWMGLPWKEGRGLLKTVLAETRYDRQSQQEAKISLLDLG